MHAARPLSGLVSPKGVCRLLGYAPVLRPVADALKEDDVTDTRPALLRGDEVATSTDAKVAALSTLTLGGLGRLGRPRGASGVPIVLKATIDRLFPAMDAGANVSVGARATTGTGTRLQFGRQVCGLNIGAETAAHESVPPITPHGPSVARGIRAASARGRASTGAT